MRNTSLKTWISRYLAFRRATGWRATHIEGVLDAFARRARREHWRGPLRISWVDAFVPTPGHPFSTAMKYSVLRHFANYWRLYDADVEILPPQPFHASPRSEPYIFSKEETRSLMALAHHRACRVCALPVVIGLLDSSGLRPGEAFRLARADVNLSDGVIRVLQSKGRPLRFVPLHSTTIAALSDYARARDAWMPGEPADPFFLNRLGNPFKGGKANLQFRSHCRQLGLQTADGRLPRLYDLRHTFACRYLLLTLRQRKETASALASLSAYLGHERLQSTYWYLSATPALLDWVRQHSESLAATLPSAKGLSRRAGGKQATEDF